MVLVPRVLYRVFPPQLKATPEAPAGAAQKLQELGAMSRDEWITLATFAGMVLGWGLAGVLGLDATAVAFLGLSFLMLANIFTMADIKASGDALETLIWFAILYTLSSELDRLGFMQYVGDLLGGAVDGMSWPLTYGLLLAAYILVHYLFVSQTAHMLALLGVFLGLSQPEVPIELMAMSLLLATNFFSVLTPQGSSCNVIFVGSGYLEGREVYLCGGIVTLLCFLVYLVVGTPWILLVL